jgi:regulator of nonsense transcripts 1
MAVGKTTTIKLNDQSFEGNVQNVRVIGRQEPTNSEKARDKFFLHVLQGKKTLRNSTFIRRLWFPSHRKNRGGNRTQIPAFTPLYRNIPDLNPSQNEAVSAMVSEEPLVIVHGKEQHPA